MYSYLRTLSLPEQAEYLTKMLVRQKSYTLTYGEVEKAEWIADLIGQFPYFSDHPENVWISEIKEDSLSRKNVFAFLPSSKEVKETVVYHSHIDTVGTEDYGAIQDIAHDPQGLKEFFSSSPNDPELEEDAASGQWLFGRGALDMQSGIAVHLVNLLYYCENREELPGNLLVMFNPDEEGEHAGIRSALSELISLKEKKGLHYVAAINNDFISPLADGDETKYIYTGAAGKLLPSFAVFGRESHVGESLLGVDSTLIAAELNTRINQNFHLTVKLSDELVLPPSCLYMRDEKKRYDVQTAVTSRIFFHYFIYEKPLQTVTDELVKIAAEACTAIEKRLEDTFELYRKTNNLPKRDVNWAIEVLTLKDLLDRLKREGIETDEIISETLHLCRLAKMDARMTAFEIVEALQQADPEKKPRVILFYGTPFLPSNSLSESESKGNSLRSKLMNILEQTSAETGETFKVRKYFPYLADGSFMSFQGSEEDISTLRKNFPAMDALFPLPLKTMTQLNIPSINLGVFGKGGHKWTERVYKPYTFHTLPKLIRDFTNSIL